MGCAVCPANQSVSQLIEVGTEGQGWTGLESAVSLLLNFNIISRYVNISPLLGDFTTEICIAVLFQY